MFGSGEIGQRRYANDGGNEPDATHYASSTRTTRHYESLIMPVNRNARFYNMTHDNRGRAFIFNHEHFDKPTLNPRNGTKVDSDNLSKVLEGLGFKVKVLHNCSFTEIHEYLAQAAEMDYTKYDCILIAVLTYGERGLLYAKDQLYNPGNLWCQFTGDRCPTLAGKPKLFFIQACQCDRVSNTDTDGISPNSTCTIPVHADFLIVLSTVPGYFSWRNTPGGSWFVQALCEELRRAGTDKDILTLLTSVCQRVALELDSNTPDPVSMHQQKRVPCITSMLTRLLVFDNQ